ncbi:hypothetical protein ACROYT_G044580 [Oculina patagonica]
MADVLGLFLRLKFYEQEFLKQAPHLDPQVLIRGTVDYKALCLLLNKGGNEDFHLGGKGYDLEFCAFCDAIRM